MDPNRSQNPDQERRCPTCRTVMQHWPALEGDADRWLCPHCDLATGSLATELPGNGKAIQQAAPRDPRQRFRWLLESTHQFPPNSPLPEWIIEELPEEIQVLLRADLIAPRPNLGPRLSDALTSALRDQGYVIQEDAGGIRLGGDLNKRGGAFSPYDVIRMAADLDGGLPAAEDLRRCGQCEAVIPPKDERCPWCGAELEDQTPSPEN